MILRTRVFVRAFSEMKWVADFAKSMHATLRITEPKYTSIRASLRQKTAGDITVQKLTPNPFLVCTGVLSLALMVLRLALSFYADGQVGLRAALIGGLAIMYVENEDPGLERLQV